MFDFILTVIFYATMFLAFALTIFFLGVMLKEGM